MKRLLGLAYFWVGSINGVQVQVWATWQLYAVVVDLTDAVAAALRTPFQEVSVENVTPGALEGPTLEHGCTADRHTALEEQPVPAAALRLADGGCFALDELAQVSTAGGSWLTR